MTRSHPSSFRDPAGFLYSVDGTLFRQVNRVYQPHYERLLLSGLYERLIERRLLIPHRENGGAAARPELAYKVLQPEPVPFISYPYEWCFSQYRDAALATLEIQELALQHGMSLRDASAFNTQFVNGRPLLIDTLSFEIYPENRPWVAYRQFCEHFLAPLALMRYRDPRLGQLMQTNLDGLPLTLAVELLPFRARLRPGLFAHLFLHAASQRRQARSRRAPGSYKMGTLALRGLVDSLRSTIAGLGEASTRTLWSDYYEETNYDGAAMDSKRELVVAAIEQYKPLQVWDLGSNTGHFSRLASSRGAHTVAFDNDLGAVEINYRECRRVQETNLLPLVIDLTNPSPELGWAHAERSSLESRGPVDLVLALALIHHLAIGNNVPLERVVGFLSRLGRHLVIEWIPKRDSQVQRLLRTREDIFDNYSQTAFEAVLSRHFAVDSKQPVADSERTIYSCTSLELG